MWRDGSLLVVGMGEVFPDRCVKTNEPAHGRRIRQAVQWHHPLIYLAHLGTPIAYHAIAALVSREVEFHVGLGDVWFRKRRRTFFVAGGIILASIAAAAYGVTLLSRDIAGVWIFCLGIFSIFAGLIYGLNASLLLSAKRITDEHVWLKGVHPDFLAELPEWGGED